jgi:hypothetical protein
MQRQLSQHARQAARRDSLYGGAPGDEAPARREKRVSRLVGHWAVGSDLQLLRAILNWGPDRKNIEGRYLIEQLSIRRLSIPVETSPSR